MIFDYHVHCKLSADSTEPVSAYFLRAKQLGMDELCFTDHFEYAYPDDDFDFSLTPMPARILAYQAVPSDGISVKFGVEAGMRSDGDHSQRLTEALTQAPWIDFIIASTHIVDGVDPYFPVYFESKTREQGFNRYLAEIYANIQRFSHFSVVGHVDYPTKGCPHEDKMLRYNDAPEVMDAIFRLVIGRGQGIELNTSIYAKLNGAKCDLTWLKRYKELGGEILTIGSDSHSAERLGEGFESAVEFARAAGLRYVCTFDKLKPIFHKI